jgi:GntR family transcriptional regulator
MRFSERYIQLNRDSGIPLYIQIKESLRKRLASAPEDSESLLPTQRELAESLGVSRNTVSMAYAELEREGLVASHVGKGTLVVSPAKRLESRNLRERLARAIEHAAEEALSMGFTIEQFTEAVDGFLRERKRRLRHIQVIFVECNREQLEYFSQHLDLDVGVEVTPILLADIKKNPPEMTKRLGGADLVVTSFYHIEELEKLVPEEGPPLVGVNLQP